MISVPVDVYNSRNAEGMRGMFFAEKIASLHNVKRYTHFIPE